MYKTLIAATLTALVVLGVWYAATAVRTSRALELLSAPYAGE